MGIIPSLGASDGATERGGIDSIYLQRVSLLLIYEQKMSSLLATITNWSLLKHDGMALLAQKEPLDGKF